MALHWIDAYGTGIEMLDQQHRDIFERLNRLQEITASKWGVKEVQTALQHIMAMAGHHFECEESCMTQYNCPLAKRNEEEHRRLVKMVQSLLQRFEQDPDNAHLAKHIHQTIEKWLHNHLLEIDVHLKKVSGRRQAALFEF